MTLDQKALRRIGSMVSSRRSIIRDLQFMARYKYDSYEIYSSTKKFLPSLLEWLNQFETISEREAALDIVGQLLYISRREMLELSRVTYQKILNELMAEIIREKKLGPFDYAHAYKSLKEFLAKSAFIGMSDGAQIDHFRRQSNNMIEEKQVIPYYKIDEQEKQKLSHSEYAFLLDDVSASGLTFMGGGAGANRIEGQFRKFLDKWEDKVAFKAVYYCPYIITEQAQDYLEKHQAAVLRGRSHKPRFKIIYAMRIPKTYSVQKDRNELPAFRGIEGEKRRLRVKKLIEKNYFPNLETAATNKGGGCKYGFGNVGIFLVRYNNTPNNTPAIIWQSQPNGLPVALFKRLERHRV